MKAADILPPTVKNVHYLLMWRDMDVYSIDFTPMDFLHFWTLGHLKYLAEAVFVRTAHVKADTCAVFDSMLLSNFIASARRQAWNHICAFRGNCLTGSCQV